MSCPYRRPQRRDGELLPLRGAPAALKDVVANEGEAHRPRFSDDALERHKGRSTTAANGTDGGNKGACASSSIGMFRGVNAWGVFLTKKGDPL